MIYMGIGGIFLIFSFIILYWSKNKYGTYSELKSLKEKCDNVEFRIQQMYEFQDEEESHYRIVLNDLKKDIESEQDKLQFYKNTRNEQIELFKQNCDNASDKYVEALEKKYIDAECDFNTKMQDMQEEEEKIKLALKKLQDSLTAGIEARLREKEKAEKATFYMLQLPQKDKYEINVIQSIESQLSDPRPVRMLIWTNYYSKKANDLCSRILGKDKITGIYRITNNNTGECYIGQAKDVKERWREHMKCGLGIDAPAGNLLYKAMQEDGIESFTFELLEKCNASDLNEKEKFYIDLYSSYNFGYNSTRGNK